MASTTTYSTEILYSPCSPSQPVVPLAAQFKYITKEVKSEKEHLSGLLFAPSVPFQLSTKFSATHHDANLEQHRTMMSSEVSRSHNLSTASCWCPLSKDDGNQIIYGVAKASGADENKLLALLSAISSNIHLSLFNRRQAAQ